MYHRKYLIKIISAIAVLLILIIGYRLFFKSSDAPPLSPAVRVKIDPIKEQDIENKITLIGSLVAAESVSVRPRIDSQIIKVNVVDGQKVEKGDVLFELDDRFLQALLAQLEANLKGQMAEFDRARQKYDRDKELADKGAVSKNQFDQSLQTYIAADTSISSTKAQMNSVKTQIDYTIIKSPIPGRIGVITIANGNVVRTTDTNPMTVINQISPIKLHVSVPQRYFKAIREKEDIKISVRSQGGAPLEVGKMDTIDNLIDEQSRNFIIQAILENKEEKLWPGMMVEVDLILKTMKDVYTVPLKAVQNSQTEKYIYRVVDGKAQKTDIGMDYFDNDIAVIHSAKEAEIAKIAKGDIVVTDGLLNIKDGSPVTYDTQEKGVAKDQTP